MSDANKETMMIWYEAVSRKDIAKLESMLWPNHFNHGALPGAPQGIEGFRAEFLPMAEAIPDLIAMPVMLLAEGDLVSAHIHMKGTNTGPFMGNPPTGEAVGITMTEIVRIVEGKLLERWGNYSELALMSQLGMLPGQ